MSWTIEVKPTAEKHYRKLDKKTRARIKEALLRMEKAEYPLSDNQVKMLTGQLHGDYRLRVGNWRVLFTPDKEAQRIYVYAILPRGNAY